MAAALKASFILQLEDRLSKGIVEISRKMEALAKIGKTIGLKGLDAADRVLDRVGSAADKAASKIGDIGKSARSAAAEVQKAFSKPIYVNTAGVAFVPPSLKRAMMAGALASAVAAGGMGGGPPLGSGPGGSFGGVRLPGPGAPYMGPSIPLLLGGGGGGMSLNFSAGYGGFERLRAGAAAVRQQVMGIAHQVQHVGKELGELGHAGLTAFATGFGLLHPISEYAKFENVLRHIAITANVAKADIPRVVAELTEQYNHLALATGQSSEKIAESAQFLITTGIGRAKVDELLPLVAQAATAYNTPIGDSVQAIFTLSHNLKVKEADMAGTVSAMALSGKEGHFSFADMSRYLPQIAPLAYPAGLKGSAGARELMAMLEVSRASAGTSGEAATNVSAFLGHLFGGEKRGLAHDFRRHGVDLQRLEMDAAKKGLSLPEAVLQKLSTMTAYNPKLSERENETRRGQIIGSIFPEKESRLFVMGAIADLEHMIELHKKLDHADKNTIKSDFDKAWEAALIKLNVLAESATQIERRIGLGFAPMLDPLTAALGRVIAFYERIDKLHPGLIDGVLMWVGGFLALSAALGLLIPLFKLVWAGASLMLAPFRLLVAIGALLAAPFGASAGLILGVIAVIGAAAYELYRNWDEVCRWLGQQWTGLKQNISKIGDAFDLVWSDVKGVFSRFVTWLDGWTGGALTTAASKVLPVFKLVWSDVQDSFGQFERWIGTWVTGGLQAAIDKIKGAWNGLTTFFSDLVKQWAAPFDEFVRKIEDKVKELRNSGVGKALGLGEPDPNAKPPQNGPDGLPIAPVAPIAFQPGGAAANDIGMTINIKVDQDGRVTRVDPSTDNRRVRDIVVDRGDMTARA